MESLRIALESATGECGVSIGLEVRFLLPLILAHLGRAGAISVDTAACVQRLSPVVKSHPLDGEIWRTISHVTNPSVQRRTEDRRMYPKS